MFTVYLVDDDLAVLKALARRLVLKGYDVQPFATTSEFLRNHDPSRPGCAILDLSMPEQTGLELQQILIENNVSRPVIFLTGRGDISSSVRAMKAGAVDFLVKPVQDRELMDALSVAEERDTAQRRIDAEVASIAKRMATLTPREHEVLLHVLTGQLNKQIAFELGTVEQTIKVHRRRVMEKLSVHTMADLMRLASRIGLSP